jgi:hypothetical protein
LRTAQVLPYHTEDNKRVLLKERGFHINSRRYDGVGDRLHYPSTAERVKSG